jgi:hypothetical protein
MNRRLSDLVRVAHRYARSTNVERDSGANVLNGYVLTSRALDVVARVVAAIANPHAGRALSLTGPYGTGKSSLAVFLAALLDKADAPESCLARKLLADAHPALHNAAQSTLERVGAGQDGFVQAIVTAQREPVVRTIYRALQLGVRTYTERASTRVDTHKLTQIIDKDISAVLTAVELRALFLAIATVVPILLIIDEFGKNLEYAFHDSKSAAADLYALQDLVEWASESASHPAVILTLQHLSVHDYAASASTQQRREWSKVLGRFADIPYTDTPAQTQALIAGALASDQAVPEVADWAEEMRSHAALAGIGRALHVDPGTCYPLHPTVVAALPELCMRYGQHERTLFSFLAGPDPLGVRDFIDRPVPKASQLPSVRLDRLYDYFLGAATTLICVAPTAARWLEIETRIRDTVGLTDPERRVVKTVAVLNLVASGGTLRASRDLVAIACADGDLGTSTLEDVEAVIAALESKGIITYRDFADEYRIWRGTDFDLRAAVEMALARSKDESVAALLSRTHPLPPVIAARHSQETGTLRIFERLYIDGATKVLPRNTQRAVTDGVVLLALEGPVSINLFAEPSGSSRPVLLGLPDDCGDVLKAARAYAAHRDVLDATAELKSDWVARQELRERASLAMQKLDAAIEKTFGSAAANIEWRPLQGAPAIPSARQGLNSAISALCDAYYPDAPRLRNEMIARRELTSQGAKARRDLLAAMVERSDAPRLGIEGYGPERAIYEALLRKPGIHRFDGSKWSMGRPSDDDPLRFQPAWDAIYRAFEDAELRIVSLAEVVARLKAPPIGLKEGPIPVILTAALIAEADDIAVYEDGTFVTRLTSEVVERLSKNPDRFGVKRYGSRGPRAMVLSAIAEALEAPTRPTRTRVASVVSVVAALLNRARTLSTHARATRRVSPEARCVRSVLIEAREPDRLIFRDLPSALGLQPVNVHDASPSSEATVTAEIYAQVLKRVLVELENLDRTLLNEVSDRVLAALGENSGEPQAARPKLRFRAERISTWVLEPHLRAMALALANSELRQDEWAAYVGMVVSGKPCMSWSDDDRDRFAQAVDQLGGAFRRVEALAHARAGDSTDGRESIQVTLTLADGTEAPRVMWIDEGAREQIGSVADEALAAATAVLGDRGREMLLATLAQRVLLSGTARDGVGDPIAVPERNGTNG